jgi:hypothetical protein
MGFSIWRIGASVAGAVIFAVGSGAAGADQAGLEPQVGGDLYDYCHVSTAGGDFKSFAEYIECVSYIEGASSMARAYSLTLQRNDVCVPAGTKTGQMVDVVMGYLAANPSSKDAPAALVVLNAITGAFPCEKSN